MKQRTGGGGGTLETSHYEDVDTIAYSDLRASPFTLQDAEREMTGSTPTLKFQGQVQLR